MTAFEGTDPYMVREQDNPAPNEVTFRIRVSRKPSSRWDSLVADCLHNYRSALDHAVWVITERYGTPTGSRTFPIYLTQREYRRKLRRDIGNTGHCGAKAVIESFQPYKAGRRKGHHPLWLLHELDRFAKHRRLGELVLRFPSYTLDITGPPEGPDVIFDDHFAWGDPLNGDAALVHVRVFSHLIEEVEMKFTPIPRVGLLQPHLNHPGPLPLLFTLSRIQTAVRDVLSDVSPICEKS